MSTVLNSGENRLLQQLSQADMTLVQPHLKKVRLDRGVVLYAVGSTIEQVYFPISGMISLLAVMKDGGAIETGIIGNEGVLGASIGADGWRSFGQAVVQVPGSAWRMAAKDFLPVYKVSADFRTLVNRYQTTVLAQAQQSAACHALHSVEARFCRWILQASDLADGGKVRLTQEFLSHMLGVSRNSVSLSAAALQRAGLVRYSRGEITLLDRPAIEDSACECYTVIRQQINGAAPN